MTETTEQGRRSEAATAPQAATAALVQALREWLPRHCATLPGVSRAIAVIGHAESQEYRVVAAWPEGFGGKPEMLAMADIGFTGRTGGQQLQNESGQPFDRIVTPISNNGQFLGALIVEADGLTLPQRKLLHAAIQGKHVKPATTAEEGKANRLAIVLDLLASCLDNRRAQSAAMAFVSELATRTGCDRVSFGRINRRGQLRVAAISNSAKIADRSNLTRGIEAAMDEAIDQGTTILFPRQEELMLADREHAALSRMQGDSHVLTVPLAHDEELTGALTLERHGATPFDSGIVELVETLAVLAGPMLELRFRDDQLLLGKTADSLRAFMKSLAGPRYPALKLSGAILAALLAWLSFASGTYRVTAPASLEGSVHRAVVAPIDGFVATAEARAGDKVSAGDVLSRLDDSDLRLEVAKWQSETEQLRKQYLGAIASHDRAEIAILSARVARAEAQLELLQSQLTRTVLRAPLDGIVVAGDLSQLLGSPVGRGDVLFEIAPLNDYRVVLEVDERDLTALQPGQQGRVALEGLPEDALPLVVEKITPVATARDGRNFFRVEARIQSDVERLRPGMAGIAKIDAGERKLAWIWSHRIIDWLRLRLWTWLP